MWKLQKPLFFHSFRCLHALKPLIFQAFSCLGTWLACLTVRLPACLPSCMPACDNSITINISMIIINNNTNGRQARSSSILKSRNWNIFSIPEIPPFSYYEARQACKRAGRQAGRKTSAREQASRPRSGPTRSDKREGPRKPEGWPGKAGELGLDLLSIAYYIILYFILLCIISYHFIMYHNIFYFITL